MLVSAAVSIHAPTWGATKCKITVEKTYPFQSTHPHGVRRAGASVRIPPIVSIHAPTWGATSCTIAASGGRMVSIHAPTWGATQGFSCQLVSRQCFNPRTHMGCDVESIVTGFYCTVSIHAPTWGATRDIITRWAPPSEFQSTHPHGVRHNLPVASLSLKLVSIHAPTWGATRFYGNLEPPHASFNPRTHMGCD